MNLIIRADATSAIGIGHMMRCIALAQRWTGTVHFVSHCDAEPVARLIQSQGFEFHGIENASDAWNAVTQIASHRPEQAIVFDGYDFVPADFRRASSLGLTVAVIDDNAYLLEYPVDVLVNQNPDAASLKYPDVREAVQLLGGKYALVRKEFTEYRLRRSTGNTPTLLVTTGGSDPVNVTPKIVEAAKQIKDLKMIVVEGVASRSKERLQELAQENSAIRVESSVLDMSGLMSEADIVVTAAGSTCWECCCLELPMLTVTVAENQRRNADSLAAADAAINLGWYEQLDLDSITRELATLIADEPRRRRIAANAKNLIDGQGASRVADTIAQCVRLRKGSAV